MSYSGRFSPVNPHKYEGDASNIWYRSLWERKFMEWCDTRSNIIKWSSEEVIVPYFDPTRGKYRRYFPDFLVTTRGADGSQQKTMVEIKPKKQTMEPQKNKKMSKAYIKEIVEWGVNSAKWAAAKEFCLDRGWKFQVITEDDLDIARSPKAPTPYKRPRTTNK